MDEDHLVAPPNLRALFVQYPRHPEPPSWTRCYERHAVLTDDQGAQASTTLAELELLA